MKPFLASLLLLTASVSAQVPESGRSQELRYSAAEVDASMEERYIDRTVDLAAAGKLDEDRRLLARLRYISAELIRAAIELKPEAAQWQWEVHTTSDPDVDALCMAGGKILVGSAFVRQLALTDGELATLLAHEVAHVVSEHPRETFSEAMLLNRLPAVPLEVVMARLDSDLSLQIRLSALSSLQESEADQLGMVLAHRAGWAAADMVSFYRKLAASEQSALVSSAYPATASRLSMAQGMARLFDE
ncbi:MAG TPA: M48 family metalloprotease [Duganella sp.]|nr:M48 family metalloprotease [Duganella sp.]